LFIADTCQAFTLFDHVETKNVLALGTSLKGENAYAHHSDQDLGLSVIERWTYGFINQYSKSSDPKSTLDQLMVAPFKGGKAALGAHVGIKENSIRFKDVQVSDFFGPKNYRQQQQRNRSIKHQVVAAHPSPAFHPEPSSLKQTLNEIGTTLLSTRATETKHEIAGKKTENDFTEEISLEPTDPAFSALVVGLMGCLLFAHFVERQAKKVAKAVA
jgi:glycosylphosphatidylinositol transamidase (GPIT) subunit GPI8